MKVHLICYDIEDDHTRKKVADILGEYGNRVQWSVFEIAVRNGRQLEQLRERLSELPNAPLDIRIYPLCSDCRGGAAELIGEHLGPPAASIV